MVTLGEFSLSLTVPYTSAALPKADGARGPGPTPPAGNKRPQKV